MTTESGAEYMVYFIHSFDFNTIGPMNRRELLRRVLFSTEQQTTHGRRGKEHEYHSRERVDDVHVLPPYISCPEVPWPKGAVYLGYALKFPPTGVVLTQSYAAASRVHQPLAAVTQFLTPIANPSAPLLSAHVLTPLHSALLLRSATN